MRIKVGIDLPMPIGVITQRDDVDARSEHLVGILRSDPDATGHVLAVDDDKIDRQPFAQRRKQGKQGPSANSTDNVSDEQNVDLVHVCASSARAYFHVNGHEAPLASHRR